jgi:RNA polymerase subunit RPABC4/transcription elongation factor Spt4
MQCYSCRQSIPDGLGVCPYCGQAQKTLAERSTSQWTRLLAMILSAAVLFAWHWLKP